MDRIPELFMEDLQTLRNLLGRIDDLAGIEGVFEIEVRVRVADVDAWAVLGYGESADPAVLRWEPNE